MRMRLFLIGLMTLLFVGCVKDEVIYDDGNSKGLKPMDVEVTVELLQPNVSRAGSSVDTLIDNLTSTRVDGENVAGRKYYLVSYHGRNGKENGMVQSYNTKDELVSEIYFPDSRINYVQSAANGGVYIAVDRKGGYDINGEKSTFCGIVAVMLGDDGKFILPENKTSAKLKPYRVNGLSVNCIKQVNNNAIVVATGGNEGLGEYGMAGFTKYATDPSDPTKLTKVLVNETRYNYRGYWVSHADGFSTYTYRTVEDNSLVYYMGVCEGDEPYRNNSLLFEAKTLDKVEVFREEGVKSNYGRYGVCAATVGKYGYVFVSTGSKEGGVKAYYFNKESKKLELVDTWHKACYITSTRVNKNGKVYIFAACGGQGVYKLELKQDGTKLTMIPVAKRVTKCITESGTPASTNYVQVLDGRVHVCGGYEGYFTLGYDDKQFIPCPERDDIE